MNNICKYCEKTDKYYPFATHMCLGTRECDPCPYSYPFSDGDFSKCELFSPLQKLSCNEIEELEFYRYYILEHDLQFELINEFDKWKKNKKYSCKTESKENNKGLSW